MAKWKEEEKKKELNCLEINEWTRRVEWKKSQKEKQKGEANRISGERERKKEGGKTRRRWK